MSATAALRSQLERPRQHARANAGLALPDRSRNAEVARLMAFAALAAYAAMTWVGLVADPPRGRAALAALAALAGAAGLIWLGRRRHAPGAWALGALVALFAVAGAGVAIGLPGRLLWPTNWGELTKELGGGLQGLGGLTYPYRGSSEGARLVILLGLPLALGLSAALAFWPARGAAVMRRTTALVVLVATYAVAATVSPPGAPLLHGLFLLVLVAAWLWLPGVRRRDATASVALVLAAGVVALPVAGRLDGSHPWLDYRNWNWSWSGAAGGESFDWNHSYGPLDWTRTGETLFEVRSDAAHYWRTVVLDDFNGYRWQQSTASSNAAVELPHGPASSPFTPQTVRLEPRWIHRLTFSIRDLSSQLVVGAGTALGEQGLDGVARIQGGLALPPNQPLTDGETYTLRAYIPDPSAARLRRASRPYPAELAPYTLVALPSARTFAPANGPGSPNLNATPSTRVTFQHVTVPLWGTRGRGRADRILARSAYAGVYRLAHHVTAGAGTPYGAVRKVETYLRSSYTYSELPPQRKLPLRAFLLKDGIGYCQQFSGAMALMLRMVGIPARVASGFSPGTSAPDGTYVVRDFDAHSWVEVYFNDIGWVPFDPTPAAAPARSQATGLSAPSTPLPPTGRRLPAQPGGGLSLRRNGHPTEPSSGSSLWVVPLGAALLALGGVLVLAGRVLRNRSLSPGDLSDALLGELDSALARLRSRATLGTTLLALERRLRVVSGPASSQYAAKLRLARYAPGLHLPPTFAERRALRRELTAGRGMRQRLRGLLAVPPGGPAGLRR